VVGKEGGGEATHIKLLRMRKGRERGEKGLGEGAGGNILVAQGVTHVVMTYVYMI